METKLSFALFQDFESIKHVQNQIEFWSARELQKLLGYAKWENFVSVIDKAKISCKEAGSLELDHFPDVRKKVFIGSGAEKEVNDVLLSRYACYLIAQNGDPRKVEIAFAQTYFAVQTRKWEIIEQRLAEQERVQARYKQSLTEKEFHKIAYERGVDGAGIARIISKGDTVLFGGKTTSDMKNTLSVSKHRALADFLPTVTIKAKDLATEMTNFNTVQHNIKGEHKITGEHVTNNKEVRNMLKKRGIVPEKLPSAEDIKKVKKRLGGEKALGG